MQSTAFAELLVPVALATVMLGLGMSLVPGDFARISRNPTAIGVGLVCQLLLLPAIGFGIAMVFDLSATLAIGLVVVSLCPGGVLSNAICHLVRGDLALSVGLTAAASLVTPFTIPLLYTLAAAYWSTAGTTLDLPVAETIVQLLGISVLPIVLGMTLRAKRPKLVRFAEQPVRVLSILLFVAVIGGVIAQNLTVLGTGIRGVGGATLALNLAALCLGAASGRVFGLPSAQSTTIAIEVGMQNAATATFVTATLLGDSTMSLPAAVYALFMVPSALALGFARMRSRMAKA